MIKNYFKIAWRNIIRHKAHSFINISGLTVGIAACLLIFVIVQYELSFNTDQPNYKNIYHVVTEQKRSDGSGFTVGNQAPSIDAYRLDFPRAKFTAVHMSYGSQITVAGKTGNAADDKKFIEDVGVVFLEPQFFDVFDRKWLSGNPAVLNDPNMVVLDESRAAKYFGDWKNAIGKTIKMDNLVTMKVAGVVADAPSNSDLPFRVMVSYNTWKRYPDQYNYHNDWNTTDSNQQIFALLPENASVAAMDAQLKNFYDKHAGSKGPNNHIEFLQSFAEMHFDTRFGNTIGDHVTSRATLNTLSFIALLIIVMASINFVNLSTAQSVGRSKEVGIRKVMGSTRPQLIAQVIGETTIIVSIAVLLAVALAYFAAPYLKDVSSVPAELPIINQGSLLFLISVTVAVILLSGLYPALVMSGFKPVLAIKNKITAASVGGIPLRRVLVVTQFCISQLLIIGTIIAVRQMQFVNNADLGFDKTAVIVMPGPGDSASIAKMASFKARVLENPAVKSVSFVSDPPSSENNWSTNFYFDHSTKDNGIVTNLKFADNDYFKTFGLRFAAGRSYEAGDTSREIVVNETFVKILGIKDPNKAIGKTVRLGANGQWLPIVGVVQDFKANSLRETVKPIIIEASKKFETEAAVKIQTRNLAPSAQAMQKLWENTYPEYAYTGFFFDESISKFYKQENQLALAVKILSVIGIFISCLGLYGLVSFMVVQRTKEVGVRKVLGASVANIVLLFSKEFMVLISIAFVLAIPFAWYTMHGWLQNFAYRINISIWVFVLAIATSIIVAWLTVGYKAVRAALVNPVRSLRSE